MMDKLLTYFVKEERQPSYDVLSRNVVYAVTRLGRYHGRDVARKAALELAIVLLDGDTMESQALDTLYKEEMT